LQHKTLANVLLIFVLLFLEKRDDDKNYDDDDADEIHRRCKIPEDDDQFKYDCAGSRELKNAAGQHAAGLEE
jgi:hypothetical protein